MLHIRRQADGPLETQPEPPVGGNDLEATQYIHPDARPEGLDFAGAGPELTDGIGFDYAFDTAAKRAMIAGCLHGTRAGGTTTLIGVPGLEDALDYPPFLFIGGEKKLQGCYLGSSNPHREFPRLLGLWRAGLLDLEGMVTKRRPLEQVGEAFEDLRKGVGIREVIALA